MFRILPPPSPATETQSPFRFFVDVRLDPFSLLCVADCDFRISCIIASFFIIPGCLIARSDLAGCPALCAFVSGDVPDLEGQSEEQVSSKICFVFLSFISFALSAAGPTFSGFECGPLGQS